MFLQSMFKKFKTPKGSLQPMIKFQKLLCVWQHGRPKFSAVIFKFLLTFTLICPINMIIYMIYSLDYHLFIVFIQYSAFMLSPIKLYLYEKSYKEWKEVIDLISHLEEETTNPEGKHSGIVVKHRKYCHWVMYSFWTVGISISITLYSNFWIHNLRLAYSSSKDVEYMVLFYFWLPWDNSTVTRVCLSMACQTCFAVTSALYIWCWDPMVIAMMVFLSGQLKALRKRCVHALDSSYELVSMQNIIKCHMHYWEVRRCIEMLNKLISPVMFIYILMVTVNFGVAIISMISNKGNLGEMLSALQMAGGLMFQLLFFFWFANDVIVQSDNLAYGIFESEWVCGGSKVQRAVCILGASMQERLAFTAGPFNQMSLATFVLILRGSYSFFTLLSITDK